MIGIIIIAKTIPAINGDLVKIYGFVSNIGMNPKYLFSNLAQYSALGIKTKKPQIPKRIEGKAAIMSIEAVRYFFSH